MTETPAARSVRPRYAFAGDRDIAVWVVDYLLANDAPPAALLVPPESRSSHADALVARCSHLPDPLILRGDAFRRDEGLAILDRLALDYIISVHWPYRFTSGVLMVPRLGALNLHPAYLPYNRGWHTPSWAILDGTPVGATLHFMDDGIDTGDIVHQKQARIRPDDTADTLYRRLKRLELEVFREAWPQIAAGTYRRTPQPTDVGSAHTRADLMRDELRRIDLDERLSAQALIRKLRALTTNRPEEAAYFDSEGRRYRLQVRIQQEPTDGPA